jgi:nucleoside-diphosphate-sugar epimerase
VYGGDLPPVVPEDAALRPESSYGTEKAIAELLLCDFTRRGYVDGRALRLPTISVRPGRPNAAASSFASGIIREPLHGEDAVCPVDPETRMWLLSPDAAIEGLVRAHELAPAQWGRTRVLNLPGVSVTVGEMVRALERAAGADVASHVRWQRDERISRLAGTWPGALDDARARALGFRADADFDAIVRTYMRTLTG